MAYKLTLSREERKAIDWIGHRYFHGDELFKFLWVHSEQTPDDIDWAGIGDITFTIPEAVAWDIREGILLDDDGAEYQLACFAPELRAKIIEFLDRIV